MSKIATAALLILTVMTIIWLNTAHANASGIPVCPPGTTPTPIFYPSGIIWVCR